MASVKQAQLQLETLIKVGMNQIVLALEGPAGLGKSAVVKQAGKNTNLPVIDLRLAQMPDCGDLTGIPYQEEGVTKYGRPEWWPVVPSILFLDEPNRGSKEVRQAVFQLLTEHSIGTRRLPANCFIVLAFNPSDGDVTYDVEPTDPAWNSRMVKLSITPDVDGWLEWAIDNDINEMVRRFISVHPRLIHSIKDTGSFPCPRTWEMLSRLLNGNVIMPDMQGDIISSIVGVEAAATFIAFMDKAYKKPISWKEIVEDTAAARKAIEQQRTDENTSTVTDISTNLNVKDKLNESDLKALIVALEALAAEAKVALLSKLSRGKNGNAKLTQLSKSYPDFEKLMNQMIKDAGGK